MQPNGHTYGGGGGQGSDPRLRDGDDRGSGYGDRGYGYERGHHGDRGYGQERGAGYGDRAYGYERGHHDRELRFERDHYGDRELAHDRDRYVDRVLHHDPMFHGVHGEREPLDALGYGERRIGDDRDPYDTIGYAYGGGGDRDYRSAAVAQPAPGGQRGKGPSGYRRSDERIREDVCDALTHDDHVDASGIEVAVAGGEITLTGEVPDRRTKRRAEACVEHVPGVIDVHNQLRIVTSGAARPR